MTNAKKVEPIIKGDLETIEPQLELNKRVDFGKKSAHKLRKLGNIPCTITSNEIGALHYYVKQAVMKKLTKSASFFATIINVVVDIEGKQKKLSIIPTKIDFHPVEDFILHIDFLHVTSNEVLVKVPVKLLGLDKAPGLKKGGKLNLVRYHLPLKASVSSVPKNIEINISTFGIGKSLFLSNLILPKGVKMAHDCLILSITGRGKKDKDPEVAPAAEAPTKQEPKKETK